MQQRHVTAWSNGLRGAAAFTLAAALAVAGSVLARAAAPSSATLSGTSGPVAWDGFAAAAAASPDGEATCVEGTTCDTFTLKLAPADYRGRRLHYKASWTIATNDYDVYVHQGGVTGPVLSPAAGSPPATVDEGTVDINAVVTAGVNDTYTIHVVYWAVAGLDPYHGVVSLEPIPVVTTPTRTATFVTGSKTGISFSHSRPLYAFGAGQDVEPNVRVDYQGNAYVGGIRGLAGGNDLWRFDLNPSSPTYDPFLMAATPTWRADGSVSNPAWKGQPDALAPNNESELGGDGGGDMDLAVGFKPAAPSAMPPTLATSSLVAANVSAQRSTDRGDTLTNNPAGNTTVQVDDRQWMEFLGTNSVYLGYREFTGLTATSKYYLNRSDDGGLTYGPAVVAAIGGNTTGNIDVDQRDGTVYFCHQGATANQVLVAVGQPISLAVTPVVFNTYVAATGQKSTIAGLFPVCKVASDGTVYVAYSDGGEGIFVAHSFDQGKTWAPPVRVSDMGPGGVALFPWMETGDRPGSLAIVWYGATAADSEDGKGGNTDNANWKVYFAQTLNATSSAPTILQAVASDHVIHASNISLAGFTTGTSPNRNLADFFQVAIDPQGLAMIAWADDSADFAGHTYVAHQIGGYNLNAGKAIRLKGTNAATPVATRAPQVFDFRHDARVISPPPVMPDVDSPADILTIGYGCSVVNGATWITATMATSGLDTVPPLGTWRMSFATNPTKPGAVDRADQWYLEADTDATGTRSYVWGVAVRNGDGSLTYTPKGPADAGAFDLTTRSVTVKVDVAKLNAVQRRGAIANGTVLMGLRGSAIDARTTAAGAAAVGLSDSTRAGGTFTMGSCQP
ncbi:MAG TPA: hypothetical protein VGP77_12360 [Vicinamibacterales bacterium]|nr:hypothetical protein [Vicinamibacterales bacterium]